MSRRKPPKSENGGRGKPINDSGNKRIIDNRETFKSIIIACEDSVSAPTYFKMIVGKLKKGRYIKNNSFVIAKHNNTHPTGVLQDLLNHKVQNTNKTYKDFDYCWIVIDRDDGHHQPNDFNNAITQAKANKPEINVAYANDAFELWYLLHLESFCTPMGRKELVNMLLNKLQKKYPTKFDHLDKDNIKDEKNTKLIFNTLFSKQKNAIKHAKNLLKDYGENHNPEKDNPSTTVHQLVELLNNLEATTIDKRIQKIVCTDIYSDIHNSLIKEGEMLPSYFFENKEFTKNKKAFEEIMAILIKEGILKKEDEDYCLISIENLKNYLKQIKIPIYYN